VIFTALVARLRPACSRGLAVAGCAPPTSCAGHPNRRAQANNALTFSPDHPMGAGQGRLVPIRPGRNPGQNSPRQEGVAGDELAGCDGGECARSRNAQGAMASLTTYSRKTGPQLRESRALTGQAPPADLHMLISASDQV
jgi:hypothetical protein